MIRERFNAGAVYKDRILKWDTVIEQKTNELARFLTRKLVSLDFVEPAPKLERQDDRELRQKILALGGLEAERLGIRKNTLHLLRKKAANVHSFKLYRKTLLELEKVTVAR